MRITALLIAMCMAAPAHAQDPFGGPVYPRKIWPDTPLNRYFKNLERPDNHLRPQFDATQPLSCCGEGDVVKTKFKVEAAKGPHPEDVWYAWLKGAWVRIPPEKIVPDHAPNGQAYLFMLTIQDGNPYSLEPQKPSHEIVCFVRPLGQL